MAVERTLITPPDLAKPTGHTHGVKVRGGASLYVAGQAAFDAEGKLVGVGDIVRRFARAMSNFRVSRRWAERSRRMS